jgi:hypothetical protein
MAQARAQGDAMTLNPDSTQGVLLSPVGPDLKRYLMKYPAEVARINSLPPLRQLAELGKIEGRIEAASAGGQVQTRETRPVGRVTRAPEPVSAVLGDRPGVAREDDPGATNLPFAEYQRIRDRMDEASGKRPRILALTR